MFFYLLTIIGAGVFATGGAIAAIKNRMDLGGVVITAFIVGTGGGTLRSILLGKGPVFWATQSIYVWVTVLVGLSTFISVYLLSHSSKNFGKKDCTWILNNSLFLTADALALGVFSVAGTEIALNEGMSIGIAIVIGMFNALGGVIFRDILCNRAQDLLKSDIYATAAFIGSASYVILLEIISVDIAMYTSVLVVLVIRIAAIFLKLNLPILERGVREY